MLTAIDGLQLLRNGWIQHFNGVTETDVAVRVGAALAVVFCICPFVLPKLFKVEACHP